MQLWRAGRTHWAPSCYFCHSDGRVYLHLPHIEKQYRVATDETPRPGPWGLTEETFRKRTEDFSGEGGRAQEKLKSHPFSIPVLPPRSPHPLSLLQVPL